MRKFDLSLRSSRSSYFATFRHQLTILSKTDALDEEKWLNMLGTFVKDWFRYESHFVHGRDSQVNAQNEMLAYQQKESTARVASIMENTNLSKQQQVSEIMRQIDRKSGSAGMPRPISYAVFCLKKKKAIDPEVLLRVLLLG